jgi:hypothetical protein
MAKNLYLRVANQLYFADHNRSAEDLCMGFIDALFDGFDFRYAYPVEYKDRELFIDKFLQIFNIEVNKRRRNELREKADQ